MVLVLISTKSHHHFKQLCVFQSFLISGIKSDQQAGMRKHNHTLPTTTKTLTYFRRKKQDLPSTALYTN